MDNDEGYTLIELMLVITLFAVFSAMVIPMTRSLHLYKIPENERLEHWLTHQKLHAVLSALPERICITSSSLTGEFWQKGRWQIEKEEFIPEPGSSLAFSEDDISGESQVCYLVGPTDFYPAGGFVLFTGGEKYKYVWGYNGETLQ
ncbi:prepilin-type N-terminal cleavage/methylation domain-containing protein [Salmonella enterica]